MMTQSVMTQAANLFGNAAGSVTSKGKQAGSGFDQVIDNSLKSIQKASGIKETTTAKKTSVQNTDVKENSKSDKTNGTAEETKAEQPTDAAKTDKTKTTQQAASTKTGETKDTTKEETIVTDVTVEPTPDEQIMAQIAGMLQSIREAVMGALNLSSEELDRLLTDQGMSVADLLQPENLQQLVLAGNGESDILATLTDENLANTMKQLLQTVEGITSEANIPLTDQQIKTLLEQVEAQGKAQVQSEAVMKESIPFEITAMQGKLESKPETANAVAVGEDDEDVITSESNTRKDISAEVTKLTDTKESNAGAQADSESDKDKDLKSADQFQAFVDNLVKVSQNTQVEFSGNLVQVTELKDIANQIIERIKVSIQPDQTTMELQLNPENLGKVNLSIQSKNGVMTAQFVVQNELSKEAIESQLHTLRETLNNQGIKVEAIEVTVSAYAFEKNNQEGSDNQNDAQKNHSGKQISLEDAINMTEIFEEESNTEDFTGVKGSQIDYTA